MILDILLGLALVQQPSPLPKPERAKTVTIIIADQAATLTRKRAEAEYRRLKHRKHLTAAEETRFAALHNALAMLAGQELQREIAWHQEMELQQYFRERQREARSRGQTLPRKLVEVRMCKRIPTEEPRATGLDCGRDSEGPILLDIPEAEYQFPKGDLFRLYIYSDGHNEFPVHQPKGSRVIKSPPCKKVVREAVRPANAGPCNPELEPVK